MTATIPPKPIVMGEEIQHIYHHYDNDGARLNIKVEKNSKGYNHEITVTGAKTVEEAMKLIDEAQDQVLRRTDPDYMAAKLAIPAEVSADAEKAFIPEDEKPVKPDEDPLPF